MGPKAKYKKIIDQLYNQVGPLIERELRVRGFKHVRDDKFVRQLSDSLDAVVYVSYTFYPGNIYSPAHVYEPKIGFKIVVHKYRKLSKLLIPERSEAYTGVGIELNGTLPTRKLRFSERRDLISNKSNKRTVSTLLKNLKMYGLPFFERNANEQKILKGIAGDTSNEIGAPIAMVLLGRTNEAKTLVKKSLRRCGKGSGARARIIRKFARNFLKFIAQQARKLKD